jgi:hypothetical protein
MMIGGLPLTHTTILMEGLGVLDLGETGAMVEMICTLEGVLVVGL